MDAIWHDIVQQLSGRKYQRGLITPSSPVHRITFDAGLTDAELGLVETRFGFSFPADLRSFLKIGLPRGRGFPDWRAADEAILCDWLDEPRRGVVFDIDHNGFWLPEWGTRPDSREQAIRHASDLVRAAPQLIPVFGHRMMPSEPQEAGNPVFSVHQTDIICYGPDLLAYFCCEFNLPHPAESPEEPRRIRFWDIKRFQEIRWGDGPCVFDNSGEVLP